MFNMGSPATVTKSVQSVESADIGLESANYSTDHNANPATVGLYTGLGRGPYGGRHLASCPPSGPQFQTKGWTSTTFAHCKLTNFIFIIAYNCFRNPSLTKLNFFLYFCLHNVLLIFS